MTADNELQDHSNDHAYFAMMPNMLDDLLNPYQYRLYAHIKRVCGEKGRCWQSTDTIAKACKMSTGKVSECKIDLGAMGLIAIKLKKRPHGGKPYHIITVTDIWHRNIIHCSTPRSPDEQPNSHSEYASSQGEIKKTPLEEDPREEPPLADSPPGDNFRIVDADGMTTDVVYLDSPIEDSLFPDMPQPDGPEHLRTVYVEKTEDDDATFWPEGETPPKPSPHEPVEQGKARRCRELGTDPLGVASVVEKNRAGVAHPDGGDPNRDGDPWADKPLRAFCALVGQDIEHLKESKRKDWPRELHKWAQTYGHTVTPQEAFECIRGVTQSEFNWMTFTSPRQTTFQEALDAMVNRFRGGKPWDAGINGKRNGASGGRNDTPQVDQSVAETMASLFDERGVRIRRE